MLNKIQTAVLEVFSRVEGNQEFAVAGGSGLIQAGLHDRATKDIDLFTAQADVPAFVDRFIAALTAGGFDVRLIQRSDTFAHLRVVGPDGVATDVDIARDFQLLPSQLTGTVMVLDPRELAANKVLALWGRYEERDLADVIHLASTFDLADMCRWAAEKDLGFRPDLLVSHLGQREFTNMANPGLGGLVSALRAVAV